VVFCNNTFDSHCFSNFKGVFLMSEYEQGSQVVFYANFIDYKGNPAVLTGTPQIIMYHRHGNTTTKDIDYEDMSQDSIVPSAYYYKYHVPIGADKSTYTVVYSGTYSDGTNGINTEDFLVINKKFFDKKGGGFVQKISVDKIWSKEEKEQVLDFLSKIKEANNFLDLQEKMDKTIDSLSLMSKGLSGNNKSLEEQKELLIKSNENIVNLKNSSSESVVQFNEKEIIENIDSVSKQVQELGDCLRKEKIELVVSQLDDLKKEFSNQQTDFDEFKQFFVSILSDKTMEKAIL
jgi:hypothetical protein